MNENDNAAASCAAFFDIDGTLTATTIVDYYAYFRRHGMSTVAGKLWYAAFLVKCLWYLVLDKIDRSRLNVVFYRNYAGLSVANVQAQTQSCYKDVIIPRRFDTARQCVTEHRTKGRDIVLVTGSLDFIMAPLAEELGAAALLAPGLAHDNGTFTGELTCTPVGQEEKARQIRLYAEQHGTDLSQSYAYGDSIADLPMLEAVGFPHVVNPDRALRKVASERGWPVHHWSVASDRSVDR